MIPVESDPRTLKVIEVITDKTAVVKQMHQKSEYPASRTFALIGCFVLGIITAAIVMRSFF